MISQRNLSLLSNRLYKEHGGRRIPEAVLERDYCLAWFLIGLSQSKLRDLLIFKGGTALKRCHFGDYRFSEDLDFTLARKAEFAEIREGLEEVYGLVANAAGIRFTFENEDRQAHVNSYTFYLRYEGPLPAPNTVKADITISEVLGRIGRRHRSRGRRHRSRGIGVRRRQDLLGRRRPDGGTQ